MHPEFSELARRWRGLAAGGGSRAAQIERVAPGFSGVEVFRIRRPDGDLALRRWPEAPDEGRLVWIRALLVHVAADGLPLPVPWLAEDGRVVAEIAGRVFQVEPWLPGRADFWSEPTAARLAAAMETLARFHQSARRLACHADRPIPAVSRRRAVLEDHASRLPEYRWRLARSEPRELAGLGEAIGAAAARLIAGDLRRLRECATEHRELVPCARDLWHDHLLFSGERVSGMIDFGAAGMDAVAADVARLLGSLVGSCRARRQAAVDAYRQAGVMQAGDERLVDLLDETGTLAGGLNWVRWLWAERREFPDSRAVEERLTRLVRRLEERLEGGE